MLKNVARARLLERCGRSRGESLLDSKVTKGVVEKLVGMQRPSDDGDDLTAREREVLTLIAEGATNKEIAAKLVVSENTARNHVSHILSKLGFNRRRRRRLRREEGPHERLSRRHGLYIAPLGPLFRPWTPSVAVTAPDWAEPASDARPVTALSTAART